MVDLTQSSMFFAPFYIRHNMRRLEHLAGLGLDLTGRTVLEPGAGVGHHSLFYLDRGCHVTAVEPRAENCAMFNEAVNQSWTLNADNLTIIEAPVAHVASMDETFDIVHCYGLLYHVADPASVIAMLAARAADLMLLETCVSMNTDLAVNPVEEPTDNPSQAVEGTGCRPTRPWLRRELSRHFAHVYTPRTQPAHDEFPTDWTAPHKSYTGLTRAVFIASRRPLDNPLLVEGLLDHQGVG